MLHLHTPSQSHSYAPTIPPPCSPALQCLDYWLHSPSGMDLGDGPDLIVFNSGMHNYRYNPRA